MSMVWNKRLPLKFAWITQGFLGTVYVDELYFDQKFYRGKSHDLLTTRKPIEDNEIFLSNSPIYLNLPDVKV